MKKWDYIIIGFAVLCLVGSIFLSGFILTETGGTPTLSIYSDHKIVYEKEFTSTLTDEIRVDSPWGYNVVTVANGDVHISEADCQDKTCTKDWHIKRVGQYIFCLPHRLIVEVKGIATSVVDDVSQ